MLELGLLAAAGIMALAMLLAAFKVVLWVGKLVMALLLLPLQLLGVLLGALAGRLEQVQQTEPRLVCHVSSYLRKWL